MPREESQGTEPLGGAYLAPGLAPTELAKRLKAVAERLAHVSQVEEERPAGLDETAKALVTSRIIDNPDKEVRLYVACCLADILRIYAPDAPYNSVTLLNIFSLMTSQLRSLATIAGSASHQHRKPVLYLLQSLATVKSCIILSELVQQGLPKADEEMVELYQCLLQSVRDGHSQKLQDQMLDVLVACTEELEVVTQPLLDTILLCLLPSAKEENPTSFELASRLVERCFTKLQTPISNFINEVLTGRGGGTSELEEHVFSLIYVLHKINTDIMLYIFPNVSTHLQSEDLNIRSRAVALMGRLFVSNKANYGKDHPRVFREFMGRLLDKEPQVRMQMVAVACMLLSRKPHLSESITEDIKKRILDVDADVRTKLVGELSKLVVNELELVPLDLVVELGERMKDKKPQIRLAAITGLSKAYGAYISSKASSKNADSFAFDDLPEDLRKKLGWVPEKVIQCYLIPDPETRLTVLEMLDEVLLPLNSSCLARTSILTSIYSNLDSVSKGFLRFILQDRLKAQNLILAYAQARQAWRERPDDEHRQVELQHAVSTLLEFCPPTDKKKNLFQKLNETKDMKVQRLLRSLCQSTLTTKELIQARDELSAKVGSKSAQGEYIRVLARRASLMFGNKEMLLEAIHKVHSSVGDMEYEDDEEEETRIECSASDFLEIAELILETFPSLLPACLVELLNLCSSTIKDQALHTRVLRMIARSPIDTQDGAQTILKRIDDLLRKFRTDVIKVCTKDGAAKQSRLAIRALLQISPNDAAFSKILKELLSNDCLSTENKRLEAVLRCLAVYAERMPSRLVDEAEKVREFVLDKVLRRGQKDGGDGGSIPELGRRSKKQGQHQIGNDCKKICAGIKFLVAHLLGLRLPDTGVDAVVLHRSKASKREKDEEEEDESSSEESSSKDRGRERVTDTVTVSQEELTDLATEVLDVLFEVLEGEGQLPSVPKMNKAEQARMRIVAASCLLKLMRNNHIQRRLMTASRWHTLAWVTLDPDEEVREMFIRKLAKATLTCQVHMKYMSMLCLAAGDVSDTAQREASNALRNAVRTLRTKYEEFMGVHVEDEEEELTEDNRRKAATTMMPEYVLPYVLHLLAHFPDFPTDQEDTARLKLLTKYMVFIVEPLVHTLGDEADNVAFLLQMTDTILLGYRDATDSGDTATGRLLLVANLFRNVLRPHIKTQANLQAYPGKIYLPQNLYEQRPVGDREGKEKKPTGLGLLALGGDDEDGAPDWGSPIISTPKARRKRPSSKGGGRPSVLETLGSSSSKARTKARRKEIEEDEESDKEIEEEVEAILSETSQRPSVDEQKKAREERAERRKGRATGGARPEKSSPKKRGRGKREDKENEGDGEHEALESRDKKKKKEETPTATSPFSSDLGMDLTKEKAEGKRSDATTKADEEEESDDDLFSKLPLGDDTGDNMEDKAVTKGGGAGTKRAAGAQPPTAATKATKRSKATQLTASQESADTFFTAGGQDDASDTTLTATQHKGRGKRKEDKENRGEGGGPSKLRKAGRKEDESHAASGGKGEEGSEMGASDEEDFGPDDFKSENLLQRARQFG